jgi:hypothetical protein
MGSVRAQSAAKEKCEGSKGISSGFNIVMHHLGLGKYERKARVKDHINNSVDKIEFLQ